MIKKTLVFGMVLTFLLLAYTPIKGFANEVNKGPKEFTLLATKNPAPVPRPAVFPHRLHQMIFPCKTCHHTKKNGKQVPYYEGMKIQKCEDCHYKGSGMPSETNESKGIIKLDTFMAAAHARCRTCHNKEKAKSPILRKKWTGCLPCHKTK